jgi:hypothetical protein
MRTPLLVATLLVAGNARATHVEIVAVMWQQDLSAKSTVENFFACLVESSTFGTTWAQQFGLDLVTWKGVSVLTDACPSSAHLAGNLESLLTSAFDTGKLPKPSAGGTSYLLYLPKGVQGYDDSEIPACQGTYCGVHGSKSYNGTTYDAALVPIDCADCPGVQVTLIGEHEAAEAIANMGTAQYEVGDSCEGPSNETMLACCGTMYPIQQLSSAQSMNDCQTIDATGNMCWMPPPDLATPPDLASAPPDLASAPPDLAAASHDLGVSAQPDAAAATGGDNGGVGSGGGTQPPTDQPPPTAGHGGCSFST